MAPKPTAIIPHVDSSGIGELSGRSTTKVAGGIRSSRAAKKCDAGRDNRCRTGVTDHGHAAYVQSYAVVMGDRK
jgi:hypothetical protein